MRFAAFLAVFWLFAVNAFAQEPLRVAIGGSYLPLHGTIAEQPAGLEIDLAQLLGAELKREVVFVNPAELKLSSIEAVVQGKADVTMNSVTPTPEREKQLAFTPPYVKLRYAIVAKEGTPFVSFEAMKGRVAVTPGPVRLAVEKVMPNVLFMEMKSVSQAVEKVMNGYVDYMVIEDVGAHLAIKNKKLAVIAPTFGEAPVALGAPLGQAGAYTAALKKLAPQIAELVAKWKPGTPFENPDDANKPKSLVEIVSPRSESTVYEAVTVEGRTSDDCTEVAMRAGNADKAEVIKGYKKGSTSFSVKLRLGKHLTAGQNGFTFEAKCANGNPSTGFVVYYSDPAAAAEMAKPVIYLYPRESMDVTVLPRPEGGVTVSEPALPADGWRVRAEPDGRLIDRDGRTWSSLFWEGRSNVRAPREGFCVRRDELRAFFDETLAALGLRGREIAEFEAFWLPEMRGADVYKVSFVAPSALDRHAPLSVTPAPDTVIRVYFVHEPSDARCSIAPQTLPPAPARSGFTVVEWGGTRL